MRYWVPLLPILICCSCSPKAIFSGARKDCVAARLLRIVNPPFGLPDGTS